MTKFLVYLILFILGYRILKKFFSPDFGEINPPPGNNEAQRPPTTASGKSAVIEDVDYEEVD